MLSSLPCLYTFGMPSLHLFTFLMFFLFYFILFYFFYPGPIGTTQPAEFESITGPEWPSLSPSKAAKKTSSGPPSAWSQPIQEKWQQQPQKSPTAHQKSSAPPVARVKSAGMPTAPSVPTYRPEQLRSRQSHQAQHTQRERYSSDASDTRASPTLTHKQHHPDSQPEPPRVRPSQVEPEVPSYLQFSLAALLSEALHSMGSKFDPYQALSEDMLAKINNMVSNPRISRVY